MKMMLPGDVRQVIDRADTVMRTMEERLAVLGELVSEQNSLAIERNNLLREQNELLRRRR